MTAISRLAIGVACAIAFAAGVASPAGAATIEVTTAAESGSGSLGQAILDSDPGDTIEIPPGTYLLTNGDVAEANDLRLEGAGEGRTTIVPSGGGDALAAGSGVTVAGASVDEPLQPQGEDSVLETKVQIVALIATLALLVLVLELVRRRRLAERYALLWMVAAVALLVLAVWRDALGILADAIGIAEPANAIFILAFGVSFVLLLHFSVATSRLSEETKILAQETARLDQELRAARGELPGDNGASAPSAPEESESERPVRPQPGSQ